MISLTAVGGHSVKDTELHLADDVIGCASVTSWTGRHGNAGCDAAHLMWFCWSCKSQATGGNICEPRAGEHLRCSIKS